MRPLVYNVYQHLKLLTQQLLQPGGAWHEGDGIMHNTDGCKCRILCPQQNSPALACKRKRRPKPCLIQHLEVGLLQGLVGARTHTHKQSALGTPLCAD